MNKFYSILSLFTISVSLLSPFSAHAQSGDINIQANDAMVLFIDGNAEVKFIISNEWSKAEKGMTLTDRDQVRTGENSWIELGLGQGYLNVIRVQENTYVELTAISPAEVNILKGELRALVEKLGADETFEIKTPMSVCGVRGTGWDTLYDGNEVTVDVFENDVFFSAVSKGQPMEDPLINAGKRGILRDPSMPINIMNIPQVKLREWSQWKEGYTQRRGLGQGSQGSGGQLQNRISQTKDTSLGMLKGKEGTFEQKDKENIDDQEEDNTHHIEPY